MIRLNIIHVDKKIHLAENPVYLPDIPGTELLLMHMLQI